MNIFSLALVLSITVMIEQWIWHPFWSLILFSVVFTLDFVAAVAVSAKSAEGFKTNKALRFILSLMAAWCILGIAHNMAHINAEFGAGLVDNKVFTIFASVIYLTWLLLNLASAIKHLSSLGFIPKPVAAFFIKYIDTHKNLITRKGTPKEDKEKTE